MASPRQLIDYIQGSVLDIRRIATMSNSITCTDDDLAQGVVCLSRGQSIGLAVDAEAGLISLTALLGAFVLIFVSHYACERRGEY